MIGFARDHDRGAVNIFNVREGRVIRQNRYSLRLRAEHSPGEALDQFLRQFYALSGELPREIILSEPVANPSELERDLSELAGHKIQLTTPSRGFKRRLAGLARRNASEHLAAEEARFLADRSKLGKARGQLVRALGLESNLDRIECFDISNIQGKEAVGSMVVFGDGKPQPKLYRRFRVRGVKEINDFAMLREILSRRFGSRRAGKRDESFSAEPDLIIIDGGKGQAGIARTVLAESGVEVPVIGLAKREEEVFIPLEAGFKRVLLPERSEALYLLQRIRDEAHRFALSYHTALRRKTIRGSALDQIPGVGPATRRELIKTLGSLQGVRLASEEQLTSIVGPVMARKIKANL